MKLSDKQLKIIEHREGALLVKAGPGSGKTRVLIERIKKLLLSKKRCKILALTFSNLAAEEMKSRLMEDQEVEELVDNVTVGTIHSFCLDIVQNRGNLIGLGTDLVLFEDLTDRQSALRDIFTKDIELKKHLKTVSKPETFLSNCLELITEKKKKFISPSMCEDDEIFCKIYQGYNEYLMEQNVIDFDDILFYAYRIFSENPQLVKLYTSIYSYICVDEAQDLNFAQYEVIKALCGNEFCNLMLVGDEKQSIYGFNGSDSSIMTKRFVEDFKPIVYELNENFRSAKSIVRFANTLENSESVSNYVYEGELKVYSFENESKEAGFVVEKIKELRDNGHPDIEGDLEYEDFAVIARNRYVLSSLEQKLKAESIPFFFKQNTSGITSESDFMKIFELSMRMIINRKDIIHLKELCSILSVKIPEQIPDTGFELIRLICNINPYNFILEALLLTEGEYFDFSKTIKYLEENISEGVILNEDEYYLICKDIELWRKHWNKYSKQINRDNRSIVSFRNHISLGKTQEIVADGGISLLTAHMSKGLQYEAVFVMGVTEGVFPDYRAVKSGGKEMEQEKNNMFVAVTRAKRLCYITYPRVKMMPWGDYKGQQKSRFLSEIKEIDM